MLFSTGELKSPKGRTSVVDLERVFSLSKLVQGRIQVVLEKGKETSLIRSSHYGLESCNWHHFVNLVDRSMLESVFGRFQSQTSHKGHCPQHSVVVKLSSLFAQTFIRFVNPAQSERAKKRLGEIFDADQMSLLLRVYKPKGPS